MIGVVVIGQSPRPEIEAELRRVVDTPIRLTGALDGLSRAEIAALAPETDDDALFTVLPDGASVVISKRAVAARMPARIAAMAGAPTLICCTGPFPDLARFANALLPSAVLDGFVRASCPSGRLGVLAPIIEQRAMMQRKWAGRDIEMVALSPRPREGELERAAAELSDAGVDAIVMDCMSYTYAMKQQMRARCRRPVILAISAVGHVLAELAG